MPSDLSQKIKDINNRKEAPKIALTKEELEDMHVLSFPTKPKHDLLFWATSPLFYTIVATTTLLITILIVVLLLSGA